MSIHVYMYEGEREGSEKESKEGGAGLILPTNSKLKCSGSVVKHLPGILANGITSKVSILYMPYRSLGRTSGHL